MIGQQIQNYLVTANLGEGGMGIVFKATDEVLGRDVALKMLHTPLVNESQFLERFKTEARIVAKLLHPNIAVIYNFIQHNSRHFMVMEYVDGYNLDQLLKQKQTLSYKLIVPLLIQALEGLHHAHKKDICHRDIKPSNLMLTPDGTIKLMDFGIAKIAGEQRLTQAARVIGTLEYMAPELIEGKDASLSTDIYALGVTAYELLTGKLPFSGSTDFNVMQDILKKTPLSPAKLDASIPKPLCDIIVKALQKKPADRFATAKDFQSALASAFPGITTVDVAALRNKAPETRLVETAAGTHVEMVGTMLHSADLHSTHETGFLQGVRRRMPAFSARQILLTVTVLVAFIVVAFTITNSRKPVQPFKREQSAALVTPATGIAKPAVKDEAAIAPVHLVSTIPISSDEEEGFKSRRGRLDENKQLTPSDKQLTPVENQVSPSKKRKTAPGTEPRPDTPVAGTDIRMETDKTVIPSESTARSNTKKDKYVFINSKLKVVMTLSGVVDTDDVRTGQLLRFTVLKPVVHDRETIIAAGAPAEGRVTLMNNRKISIAFTSVEAVNGQKILFDKDELDGRPDKVLSRKHFTGVIRKGLSLVL